MLTEGRDGARWPWLPSRPDRALRYRRCTNVLVGQHTVLVAFPALLSFASAGHGTNGECAIYMGFRVVGNMVRSRESVQTPFTIEWVIVDAASIFSSLCSRPVAFLVELFLAGMWAWHGYLPRICTFCLITRTSLWYQSGNTLQ